MYYEEKIVHGVLMSRGTPDGDWTVVTYASVLAKYLSLKAEIANMRAAANAEYEARKHYCEAAQVSRFTATEVSQLRESANFIDRLISG